MSKNLIPEVAKMLGVEVREPFEILLAHGWIKVVLSEEGLTTLSGAFNEVEVDGWFASLVCGLMEYRKIPKYTIPEDTPVDAKVWVRDKKTDAWEPWHFAGFGANAIKGYPCWKDGCTSFSIQPWIYEDVDLVEVFTYCITDEEYQRRKEEGSDV